MSAIKFKLAAFTDAAGRFNAEAPRHGNEDNMFVNAMLGKPVEESYFQLDKETELTKYGCILVVADGMGGMNAGEVASEIAVRTIEECFLPDKMKPEFLKDWTKRENYLKAVIEKADAAIKVHANDHPECEGMGSTVTIAWICDNVASIAWCGDSRIYLFREPDGLERVSKDHSYVQELVDKGSITEDEAFVHPYNNVITRSLGEVGRKAEADVRTLPLFQGDILLLNSDGLSGVLHDEEMEQIIRENRSTMSGCRLALWNAAEQAGWHDNVTAVLCEITEGEPYLVQEPVPTLDPNDGSSYGNRIVGLPNIFATGPKKQLPKKTDTEEGKTKFRMLPIIIGGILLCAIILFLFLRPQNWKGGGDNPEGPQTDTTITTPTDSTKAKETISIEEADSDKADEDNLSAE